MSHLDICSPSYGQKKGRESWPLKVGNRPAPNMRWGSAIQHWKALDESYNIGSDLVQIGGRGEKLWPSKSQKSKPGQFRDSTLRVPRQKAIRISLRGVTQSILYGGRWWLPPSSGRGESSESKCPWLVPTPKGVPECELTLLWLVLDADSSEIILVPLPSLIPGLLTRPFTPL
jgi:hypothetical protein